MYAKHKATEAGKVERLPEVAGSVWTFVVLDTTSKLLLSWVVRKYRNSVSAIALFKDLRNRIEETSMHRHTICTDKLEAYQIARIEYSGTQ